MKVKKRRNKPFYPTARATAEERQVIDWIYKEFSVDKNCGVGCKGKTSSGVAPRPVVEKHKRNLNALRGYRSKLPLSPLVNHLRNIIPAYVFSEVKYPCFGGTNYVEINIDVDNHYRDEKGNKIYATPEEVLTTQTMLLSLLNQFNFYTTTSTHGKGFHNLIRVSYTLHDVGEGMLEDFILQLKKSILDLQEFLRQWLYANKLKSHIDVLGLVAEYEMHSSGVNLISKSGTWVKLPSNLMDANVREQIENRGAITFTELQQLPTTLSTNPIGTVEKTHSPLPTVTTQIGSTTSPMEFGLVQPLREWFIKQFGSDSMNIHLTANSRKRTIHVDEFIIYTLATMKASELACNKTDPDWMNTVPVRYIQSIASSLMQKYGAVVAEAKASAVAPSKEGADDVSSATQQIKQLHWNAEKLRWTLKQLESHNCISWICHTWQAKGEFLDETTGEIHTVKGIARKFVVNNTIFTLTGYKSKRERITITSLENTYFSRENNPRWSTRASVKKNWTPMPILDDYMAEIFYEESMEVRKTLVC